MHVHIFFVENNSYRGNWSLEGCSMNMEESNTTSGIFVCECSHLTNFAVLMVHFGSIVMCKPYFCNILIRMSIPQMN